MKFDPPHEVSAPTSSVLTSRKTIALMAGLAFLVSVNYALSRSTIESLYNDAWNKRTDLVWLAAAAVVLCVISVYNYFAVRVNLWNIFRITLIISAGLLVLLAGFLPAVRFKQGHYTSYEKTMIFLLCIWKDVYIVILIEILWTFANLVIKNNSAKSLYGLFALMGSFGDFVGTKANQWITPWNKNHPGVYLDIWLVLPGLVCAYFVLWLLRRQIGPYKSPVPKENQPRFREGLKVVSKSSYLLLILLTVGLFQLATGFIQQHWEILLHVSSNQVAQRSTTYLLISVCSIGFGILSFFVLPRIPLKIPLFGIPSTLAAGMALFLIHPTLFMVSLVYLGSKSYNYSLFRAAKEALYQPITPLEKIQGKALIDMFVYRFGKAIAALLLLLIYFVHFEGYLGPITLGLLGAWLLLTFPLIKQYHKRTKSIQSQPIL